MIQRLTPAAAAAAALAASIAAVLLGDGKDGFWAKWPFLSSLLSGFATLAVTVFVLDVFLRRRERRRWANVAAVGYRALGRSTRTLVGDMALLYSDPKRLVGLPWHQLHTGTANKHPLDQTRHAPPKPEKLMISALLDDSLASDYAADGWIPLPRLRALLEDCEWVDFADTSLSHALDINRQTVGDWASVMLGADEPRAFLDNFARLNDDIFALQNLLRALVREQRNENRKSVVNLIARAALRHWQILDGKGRLLCNYLWAAAGEPEHTIAVPTWLLQAKDSISSLHVEHVDYPVEPDPPNAARTTCRKASLENLQAIQELIRSCAPDPFRSAGADEDEIRQWLSRHSDLGEIRRLIDTPQSLILVAVSEEDTVVGVGVLSRTSQDGEVHSLYVRDPRKGIGSQLLAELLFGGMVAGISEFHLKIVHSNDRMQLLAEKFAFESVGEQSGSRNFRKVTFRKMDASSQRIFPYHAILKHFSHVLNTIE